MLNERHPHDFFRVRVHRVKRARPLSADCVELGRPSLFGVREDTRHYAVGRIADWLHDGIGLLSRLRTYPRDNLTAFIQARRFRTLAACGRPFATRV